MIAIFSNSAIITLPHRPTVIPFIQMFQSVWFHPGIYCEAGLWIEIGIKRITDLRCRDHPLISDRCARYRGPHPVGGSGAAR
jgi:hypothetical protein